MPTRATHNAILDAEREVASAQRRYLERFGWTYTCTSPGAHWFWEREWNGKTLLVDTGTAIYMTQAELDQDDPEEDDEA